MSKAEQSEPEVSGPGKPIAIWIEKFRVHSYEVDLSKKGTLESLCQHFQEAAWNHAEYLEVGYERLQRENRVWVLARLVLNVERHPRWGETVTVQTWPRKAKSVFALRDFEMFDSTGVRLVSGASAWLVLDTRTRKPQRVDRLVSGIEGFSDRRALEQDPQKLDTVAAKSPALQLTVRYSDIDVNGHVNNARYVGWIMDSYPFDFHQTHRVTRLEVNYLGETIGGQSISVLSQETTPGEYRHSIMKTEAGNEVCRAKLLWCPT